MNRAEWLALSDERELHDRLRQADWHDGYRAGRECGWQEGYDAAEADMAAAWHAVAEPVAHPERGVARRLNMALAGERRDHDEHWRSYCGRIRALARDGEYTSRARACPAGERTYEQVIVLLPDGPATW